MILQSFTSTSGISRLDLRSEGSACILILTSVVILTLFDTSQLSFLFAGAVAYGIFQATSPKTLKTPTKSRSGSELRCGPGAFRGEPQKQPRSARGAIRNRAFDVAPQSRPSKSGPPRAPHATPVALPVKPDVYKESSHPVSAPKFESTGFDAEVTELVSQLSPSADEEQCLQRLVLHVKRTLHGLYPTAEVNGFIHSSVVRGTAFGVAVPEVDIVAHVSPEVLMVRQRSEHQRRAQHLEMQRLHKCATRSACDRLVSSGLKFRRSAFRGGEPRVTLMVPSALGFFAESIPVDFSINAVIPFYSAALLTECGQFEPRAKALIMLVKRWAKDRGICFAAKGHLSPYLWTLLVMYFLQVGLKDISAPLLPLLDAFRISSINDRSSSKHQTTEAYSSPFSVSNETLSIADLFNKFVEFYAQHFDFRNEAISVRSGKRAPPGISLPLHIILREDGTRYDVGPSIEDPFNCGNNLGACMNDVSLPRLHEEFTRALELCARGASLSELLEPWAPESTDQINGIGFGSVECEEGCNEYAYTTA